jgi:uncharacterized Zn ribbon protein
MKTYRLYTYDVWGNEKDGYEVNDVFKSSELYSFDEKLSYENLIKELKKQGLIKKGLHVKSIEIGGDDLTITFDYKGKPEFELRQEI